MKDLIIFGAGDIAQLADFYFEREGKFRVKAFVVDDAYKKQSEHCGKPVVASSTMLKTFSPEKYTAFVAISYAEMNKVRERKYLELKKMGYPIATYLSPQATCLTEHIGENCFILEDNTLQPFCRIGNNVTLWSGNHIGHHSTIGDNTFISSHVVVSGGVKIGKNCFLGVNATLRDHITLGDETMVGAGAIVVKDTAPREVHRAARSEKIEKTSDQIKI
jgi:sugar O-acyltransferase (sialic acid O-acetyltransferase NeuD family)